VSRPGRLRREPERARIDALTHDGRGVAHVDGRAVFVPGALAGEEVRIERVRRRRGHDEARLLEVLAPSPARVTPRCAYFGACGGCALQHLARDAQLDAKQSVLVESLRRIGHVTPETVLAPLAGDAWHYRRRARLSVRRVAAKGRTLVGFRERAGAYVTDMRACEVLAEPAAALIGPLADLVDTLSIRERVPQVEVAVAGGETFLVMRVLDPPTDDDRERLRRFAAEHRVRWYLQPDGPDSARPLADDTVLPRYRLEDFDVEIEFAPTEFVQVNGELNARLVGRALELLAPGADDEVLDLYCGVGNFTLPLARRAAHVTGVEGATELVERARSNAARAGLANASFHVADLNADAGELPWARRRYDLVLLDPPRAGAAAVLEHVSRWQPRRIVYVSCDPATLARDAGRLVGAHGMRLVAAGIADMFPHTAHVEAVALFEPRRRAA
jgi:23S rRNA (uracil1939-C5)-methyltransferase